MQSSKPMSSLKCRVFNFENISVDSEKFIKFTGLALDEFHIVQNFLDPGKTIVPHLRTILHQVPNVGGSQK